MADTHQTKQAARPFADGCPLPAEAPLPLGAPTSVGPYELCGVLGKGGMGLVYRAIRKDGREPAEVALKVLNTHHAGADVREGLVRFEREAEVLSRLDHPGIVKILDRGVDANTSGMPLTYYAMEFIRGWTLHELLEQRGQLPPKEAVRATHDAALALAAAHRQSIIHRDIKPSNVFVTQQGRVVVADFGAAQVPDATQLTRQGQVLGTVAFVSPEQLKGARADARSDVFSLAAMLCTLCTGKLVRDGRKAILNLLLNMDAEEDFSDVVKAIPGLPGGLEKVLLSALSGKPELRPPDGEALAKALKPFAGDVPAPLPPTPTPMVGTSELPAPLPYAAAGNTGMIRVAAGEERSGGRQAPPTAPLEEEQGVPHLIQTTGQGKGRVFALAQDSMLVGRAPDCDLVLPESSVSARHALIRRVRHHFEVEDIKSTNGISVNGVVAPEVVLRRGDLLMVGLVGLRYVGANEDLQAARARILGVSPPGSSERKLAEGVRARQARGYSGVEVVWIAAAALAVGACLGLVAGRLF
ncbi:MAG: FHA domain-containing serine/threonine-protein kinase [Myxococcota bacterium]